MNQDLKVRRVEAGNYHCEYNGKRFTVYRITSREYTGMALKNENQHGSYTFVKYANISHWAFNILDGQGSFGGYGTKAQALDSAVKRLGTL